MEEDEKGIGMEMIRKKVAEEWGYLPYYYQKFNKDETPDWRHAINKDETANRKALEGFFRFCQEYIRFDFSIETKVVGGVKLSSYSDLLEITDFNDDNSFIGNTLSGRVFRGTIGTEGSDEKRSVIVKTWDFALPYKAGYIQRPYEFCDHIELFINKEVKKHPKMAKLCAICCDTRLAAVYDENITTVLSDVLLEDDFGWDDRIKVAIQLADLFAWLHEKGIILGSVTASCIMIEDEELNIKVYDFGSVSNRAYRNSEVSFKCHTGREAPDSGNVTMKSDVYVFGLLLVELITKKNFEYSFLYEARRGKENLVDESFKEVDPETASKITNLAYRCTERKADNRPTMKDVLDVLKAVAVKMGAKGEKRKRDENEAAATLLS